MGRVTVYLPDELEARMQKARESGALEVSAVCQQAIEEAVIAIESAPSARVARIVQRLKRTRTIPEQARDIGYKEGRRWAEDAAAWVDIKRVTAWGEIDAVGIPREYEDHHWIEGVARVEINPGGDHQVVTLRTPDGAREPYVEGANGLLPSAWETRDDSLDCLVQFWHGFRLAVSDVYKLVAFTMSDAALDTEDVDEFAAAPGDTQDVDEFVAAALDVADLDPDVPF